eukprot:4169763-Pyramimonas_sp.AAC.1
MSYHLLWPSKKECSSYRHPLRKISTVTKQLRKPPPFFPPYVSLPPALPSCLGLNRFCAALS